MKHAVRIWSFQQNAWWAPNHTGYSETVAGAGLYGRADAELIVRRANLGCDATRPDEEIREVENPNAEELLGALVARGHMVTLHAEAGALGLTEFCASATYPGEPLEGRDQRSLRDALAALLRAVDESEERRRV